MAKPWGTDYTDQDSARRTLIWLTCFCGALIAIGITIAGTAPTTPPVLELGDVSEAEIVEIRDHRNVTVLTGEFRSRVDSIGNIEKDAALTDRQGRTIIGEVELEIPEPSRENRRPELEVDVLGLSPREAFTVVIDDRTVGAFTTDDRGSVDMELQEGESPMP